MVPKGGSFRKNNSGRKRERERETASPTLLLSSSIIMESGKVGSLEDDFSLQRGHFPLPGLLAKEFQGVDRLTYNAQTLNV